jgi:hypothetical protein
MTSSGSEGLASEKQREPSFRPLTAGEPRQIEDLNWAATAPAGTDFVRTAGPLLFVGEVSAERPSRQPCAHLVGT